MAYHTYHGLETRIARIQWTAHERIAGCALRGEDLTISATVLKLAVLLCRRPRWTTDERLRTPVNIGNPHEIRLAICPGDHQTREPDKSGIPPVNDPMQRQPDISKAKEVLDCISQRTRATYAWFKNLPEGRLYRKHRDFEDYKRN